MRVYIAGPMTGLPENNGPAFAKAWRMLHDAGHDPISPHFLESSLPPEVRERMGTGGIYRSVLPIDVFAMSTVDAVLALPGWQFSRGAKFEKHFADLCDIPWVSGIDIPVPDLEVWISNALERLKETQFADTLSTGPS